MHNTKSEVAGWGPVYMNYSTDVPHREQNIKVYPLLGRAVLRVGADFAYRAWLMLRSSKPGGYQWHTRAEVISTFAAYGLSRSRWYALLDDPHFSTFFDFDELRGWLILRGLKSVCLDLETLPGTAVWVDRKSLHRLDKFRAVVYASRYGDKPVRIGRNTIAEETGVSRTSQWRYEGKTGVTVTKNYESVPVSSDGEIAIPESMANAKGWNFVRLIDGKPYIVWQTVNTFTNDIERAPRGMARKVSNAVRSTLSWAESERRSGHFVDFRDKKRTPAIRGTVAIYHRPFADIHPVKPGGHCLAGDLWELQTVTI